MSKAKKIIIRVLLIIFVMISILSIIFTVITIANRLSNRVIPTGIISENGFDVLHIASIAYYGDHNFLSSIVGDSDVVEINYVKRGWELIPKKSGHCGVVREYHYGEGITNSCDMYDITVDENLKITYTEKMVERFYPCNRVGDEDFQMNLQKDGNSVVVPNQTAIQVFKEMYGIYGTETSCHITPDLSECAKITYSSMGNYVVEFYISDDKMYYCNVYAGNEEWFEFTPDEFFSLDGINELLDLKD